jgi:geranylgeranyl pyrophosphate synthase
MKVWMEKVNFDPAEKVAFFTEMYDRLSVREACEKRIKELFEECDGYISRLSVPEEKKACLKAFAGELLNRNL